MAGAAEPSTGESANSDTVSPAAERQQVPTSSPSSDEGSSKKLPSPADDGAVAALLDSQLNASVPPAEENGEQKKPPAQEGNDGGMVLGSAAAAAPATATATATAAALTGEEEDGLKGLEDVLRLASVASSSEDGAEIAVPEGLLSRAAAPAIDGTAAPTTTMPGSAEEDEGPTGPSLLSGGSEGAAAAVQEEQKSAVTVERKDDLLLRARKSRNQWIGRVPTPYREQQHRGAASASAIEEGDSGGGSNCGPWWHTEGEEGERSLAPLGSIHATRRLPSALPVLSLLYGLDGGDSSPAQVADRIRTVVAEQETELGADADKLVPTAGELLESELASNRDDSYLRDYHAFWTQLQDPACAMLVQGMRNFCGKIKDVTQKAELVARLKAYLRGAFQSLQTHALWKKDGACDDRVRRALEAFVYGQCYPHIGTVLLTNEAEQKEREWADRLNDLQFVTPDHLDIACLSADRQDLHDILKKPIEALMSVRLYYSAYDKLQRILSLYHGVNEALSAAMNDGKKDGAQNKLPSADDVLPTIILIVLLAKPERLRFDLEVVEDFSPPEYLRGEAGYAFTNLYGAVHFLQDLDLDEPKSLSISPEELRKGLEASRAKSEKRIRSSLAASEEAGAGVMGLQSELPPPIHIPPIEVRRARLRGEEVDLDWAARWTEQTLTEASAGTAQAHVEQGRSDDFMRGMPSGFNRTYTFLTTRPEDVKLSDLPKLLSEYRSLVHTTELLLAERAEKARAERKAKSLSAERDLYARVRKVDPSLLPKK